jgi:outer membrane protein TolC
MRLDHTFVRRTLTVALLSVPAAPAAQTPPVVAPGQQRGEPTVTLEQAVELAWLHSPALAQRVGAVDIAESAERTTLGAFLPSLSFGTGASLSSAERFNPTTNTSVTGSNDSYNASLSSGMDIFTGGRRFAQRSQAQAQRASAEASVVEQRFAVALAVKRAFFDVLRGDELIRVADARVERAQRGLYAAQQRLAVGSATRSESLRAQLALNQARQAGLQARNQRRAAAWTLGSQVGVNGPVAASAEESLEPRPLAIGDEELRRIVTEDSPAVISAETDVQSTEAAARVSRAQYYPSLRASGGYTWNNQAASFSGGRKSWNTGLSLSYPIFNGFSREDANERANVNLRVARVQLDDARRQALAGVEQAIDALRLAEEQIDLSTEALRVAQEDLRVQEARYTNNASTILDQITSQVAVAEAEQSLIAARYDYQVARAQLEALVGREL